MAESELLLAVTGAILSAAALLFAIVQTTSAMAQYLASMNRCGRAITGAFELRQGFFWSLLSLTLNPRYRMPVLTMPGLRSCIPTMDLRPRPDEVLRPGKNYDSLTNSYMDRHTARITGPRKALPVSYGRTVWSITIRILLSPLAVLLVPLGVILCIPCELGWIYDGITTGDWELSDNGGSCGGWMMCVGTPFLGLRWLFEDVVKRKAEAEVKVSHVSKSTTPGLEPASWTQFLLGYQATWWGHSSIRWEWRLASLIPADMYGASIETTMADLQLLAALGGMHFAQHDAVMARTLCGEQFTMSHHGSLGPVAYYRSGRENIRTEIDLSRPMQQGWLSSTIEARRIASQRHGRLSTQYRNRDVVLVYGCKIEASTISSVDAERVVRYLARQRTIYDAQLSYSCGATDWALSLEGFRRYGSALLEQSRPQTTRPVAQPGSAAPGPAHNKTILTSWQAIEIAVFWGPLGKGTNSCSCIQCCRDWYRDNTRHKRSTTPDAETTALLASGGSFWPALMVHDKYSDNQGALTVVGPTLSIPEDEFWWMCSKNKSKILPTAEIFVQTCCVGVSGPSHCCGSIAKLDDSSTSSMEQILAAVAVNTQWLARAHKKSLLSAAEELVFGPAPGNAGSAPELVTIKNVMAYNEMLLLRLREHVGSANVWDSPLGPSLEDFSPVVLGA